MKTTKKNWILRLTGIALVFTLVSSCLLSGTLAKYITSVNGNDTARVAKWGVDVAFEGGLFDSEYLMDDLNNSLSGDDVISVKSESDSVNVLAPGTSGTAQTFSITGRPEVAVSVQVDTTGSTLTGKWTDKNEGSYEPVVWSLHKVGSTNLLEGTDGSFEDLLNALKGLSEDYLPNTDLSDIYGTYVISWEWVFDNGDNNKDVKDTYLGNLTGDDVPGINFNMSITVTQIN